MIVAQGAWGSDVPLFPPEIWQWGPWVGLLFVALLASIPIIRDRIKRRDDADEERRKRADEADQARRDAADKERRDGQAMLLKYLQDAAADSRRRMEQQEAEFLKALDKRDQQAAEQNARTVAAMERLTAAINDSLQRRQQQR